MSLLPTDSLLNENSFIGSKTTTAIYIYRRDSSRLYDHMELLYEYTFDFWVDDMLQLLCIERMTCIAV